MNIYRIVADFCAPLIADREAIFTAESITTAFIDAHIGADWPQAPADMKAAVYIGVQQIVRPLLRRSTRDDEQTQINLDLPEESLLQDRYSIPAGNDATGQAVFKYVPRHLLTAEDVRLRCALDRKLSEHYARRARALESWFNRQQGLTA